MRLKVILIFLILAAWVPVGLLNAEGESKCVLLKKLLDRYAMSLPWKSDSRSTEAGPKTEEFAAGIREIALSTNLVDKAESLLSKLKACRQQPMSAQFGMAGYLTDLRFRMGRDPAVRKKCEGLEPLYNEVLKECAGSERFQGNR